ncbi:hypothetical protein [Pseudoramibacter faecis]|uniref:hypothetical protein n=1 Tax=Pseudoramibacter faecis TaxID=3108534 RepID=UPI002E78317C|nr:hypothetical protein [Pseudoramibacter sp. HA2172]
MLTLGVSGIVTALTTAQPLCVPMVFAKKTTSVALTSDAYTRRIFSFTKKKFYDIRIDRRFLNADDRVLIIDDFLAVGQALSGMLDLCAQADAAAASPSPSKRLSRAGASASAVWATTCILWPESTTSPMTASSF